MATLDAVEQYLHLVDSYTREINCGNNYEEVTRPLVLKIADAASIINRGNLVRYVNMITESALQIYNAADDHDIRFGFYSLNVSVRMLRDYLATHWWQFCGNDHQQPFTTVPHVTELVTHND